MTNRIRSILEQLEQTREDLLALSDDIWLSIDHNDGDALDAGVEFKRRYNAKMAESTPWRASCPGWCRSSRPSSWTMPTTVTPKPPPSP
ncbi:MAG: hypothetical protein GVY09_14570 [Gammaproteobacteria bacterium]|jgi:hypothetical protein|nr:hypothetical protein [Gammaproteobacteria bacterium]